jgi:hypothetical protein
MTDYDKSIHINPDAQAWAKFFISTIEEQNLRLEDIDESLMIGWFANAIMAMHDYIKAQRQWVGLTDEEELMIGVATGMEGIAIRMIEAKLKEKNG